MVDLKEVETCSEYFKDRDCVGNRRSESVSAGRKRRLVVVIPTRGGPDTYP